jgi:hypothetical protein
LHKRTQSKTQLIAPETAVKVILVEIKESEAEK